MKNMKISAKLSLGFLVIIILSILLASIGIFSIVSIKENNTYLKENSIEQELILKDVILQFTLMRYRAANYAMEFENPDIITNTLTPQFKNAHSSFIDSLNLYLKINENDVRIETGDKQTNKSNADRLNSLVTQQFVPVADNVRTFALAGDSASATKTLRDAISVAGEINELIGEMIVHATEVVADETAAIDESANNRIFIQIFIIVLSVVFSILLAVYVTRSISNQIYWYQSILDYIPMPLSITDMQKRTTFINKPAEDFLQIKRSDAVGKQCNVVWKASICNTENCGIECLKHNKLTTFFCQGGMDFRVDSNYLCDKSGKKTGHIEVVQDLTSMMKKQREDAELVVGIKEISDTFVASTRQVSDGSQVLAQNSTEQSSTVQELSQSLSDITNKTKSSADMAEKAANLANTIKTNAEKGSRQMDEMINAVKEINDASQSIGNVIKTIDDIAFQTNILALNAAVEAARAGEAGKGFAVVAEEVRNLASKSADAAKDTAGLIENSMNKSELGTRIAGETAESLSEIVAGINESSQLIFKIAKSSEEQSNAIMQINSGIEIVTGIIQQTSATAEESAAASEEMSSQASYLEKLLNEFQLKNQYI